MDGKTLIHPAQIGAANEVFSPSMEELEHSKRVILAHEEAKQRGEGVTLVDGKLVEQLHVDAALRVVRVYAALAGRCGG